MTKTTKIAIVAGALALGAACGKKADEAPAGAESAAPPAPPSDDAGAAPPTAEIAQFPDMIPMGGTKVTKVAFTIYQAPDQSSPVVSRVGPGTMINLKGARGSWMLIEYPAGVAQLKPGWINLDRFDRTKIDDAPSDAGVKDAAPDAAVDAGPVDAGPVDAGPADAASPIRARDGGIRIVPRTPKPG